MKVFKPICRQLTPRISLGATLSRPENDSDLPPAKADVAVVEMYDDDGWKEWQDSVFVNEFTNDAMETVPGELK